jgi:allantoinase
VISSPPKKNTYDEYLANCPEYWELAGLNLLEPILRKGCGVRVHITGISSARGLNKVRKLRLKIDSPLTSELAASYLFFNEDTIMPGDTNLKVFPPIRSRKNCELLWECLKYNSVDCLVSKHEPVHPDFKFRRDGTWSRAVPGINSLGFTLQATWTVLKKPLLHSSRSYQHYIIRLFKWLSERPARILGIEGIRGSIAPGKLADFVIWDPRRTYKCTHTYSRHMETSPYVGTKLNGKISHVYLRGKLAYSNGHFSPSGVLVSRSNLPPSPST